MEETWHSPELMIVIILALVGYITTLIAVIYRNLKAEVRNNRQAVVDRLDTINGAICTQGECLDDHEKRLIREEEKRKAHQEMSDLFSERLAYRTRQKSRDSPGFI